MLKKITEEELEFLEYWNDPICLIECLFNNFDNLSEFNEEKFGNLRVYQFPLISYEPAVDTNVKGLTQKQKFNLRKGLGDIVAFGSRKHGKTLCVEKLDIPISLLHDAGWKVAFSSYDAIHIDAVLDDVRDAIENHKILRFWKKEAKKSPKWMIKAKNNWQLDGVNQNILSKSPGNQWFGKHVFKLWIEESSFETAEVYDKRKDALSELGAVIRLSGMTNFTRNSPAGDAFYNEENRQKNKVINLPQYVNPLWDEEEKQKRIKEYGGQDSLNFRIFVGGEVVEDGVCVAKGTRITMADLSQKNIEDISIGDEILAFSEHPTRKFCKSKVLKKINNGIKKVYEISSKENKLFITPEHKVIAYKRKSYAWEEIKECLARNYEILNFNNIVNNYSDYYFGMLLGVIESDGTRLYDKNSNKYSIYISQSKNCEFEAIEHILNWLKIKYSKYDVKNNNMFRYCIHREFNVDIEKVKKQLKNNKDYALGFLSGFIIGDGWITKKGGLLNVTVQNNDIKLQLLNNILKWHNIKHWCYYNKNKNNYTFGFPRLEILLYCPMSKKAEKFINAIFGSYLWKLRAPVVKSSECFKEVYDLVTEAHTYVANGFCVHNCEFDMERVKKCYTEKQDIKKFEIAKDRFNRFRDFIIIDRPPNVDRIFASMDVGESAGSEIALFSELGDKYKYLYNITLYNLTHDEQTDILIYLIDNMKINVFGIDCGDGTGRAIYRNLEKKFSANNLVWYDGSKKIEIDFAKDENGDVVYKKGVPVYSEEYMSEWSVRRLKILLYEQRMIIPTDYKLDSQLSSVISMQSGTRTTYACPSSTGDHLFDAFRVFAISQWLKKDFNQTKPMISNWCAGVSSWKK